MLESQDLKPYSSCGTSCTSDLYLKALLVPQIFISSHLDEIKCDSSLSQQPWNKGASWCCHRHLLKCMQKTKKQTNKKKNQTIKERPDSVDHLAEKVICWWRPRDALTRIWTVTQKLGADFQQSIVDKPLKALTELTNAWETHSLWCINAMWKILSKWGSSSLKNKYLEIKAGGI